MGVQSLAPNSPLTEDYVKELPYKLANSAIQDKKNAI